jgi:uncharacterized membrane protein
MNRTYWASALILIAAAFAATAWLYPGLPETIPMHWNIRGEVDKWGSRATVWIMPAAMVAMLGLFVLLPKISPKPFDLDRNQPVYLFVMVLLVGLMGYMHAVILWASFSPKADAARALVGGGMLMLVLLGNVLGKIKRNLYIGVRTPWTIVNERVWADTHRVAAWWFVGAGLIGAIACLVGLPIWVTLIPLAAALIWPVLFSYLRYKQLEREGKLTEDPAKSL